MASMFKTASKSLGFMSSEEDAKLAFRSSSNGIKRLSGGEDIDQHDVAYWSQYYMLFQSTADVYALITVEDIRQTLMTAPKNLRTLLVHLCTHLFSLVASDQFPSPISASSTFQQTLALLPTGKSVSDPTNEVLNCLRVIGRILPVLYEAEAGLDEGDAGTRAFVEEMLWENKVIEVEEEEAEPNDQFVIDDDDEEEEVPPKNLTNGTNNRHSSDKKTTSLPSLTERLYSCAVDLMFCEGFTLPVGGANHDGEEDLNDKINYCIWESGVGSTVNIGSSPTIDQNKSEVLRFFIILLSPSIYTPPGLLPSIPSKPLQNLVQNTERRLVLSLLCSWLNTALNHPRAGWSVPYSHKLIIKGKGESRDVLRKRCLQGLLIALDYWGDGCDDIVNESTGVIAPTSKTNSFRFFISKLHRKEDFSFIIGGIFGILNQHLLAAKSALPGSQVPPPFVQETLMLLWKLIDLNKRFRSWLLADPEMTIDVMSHVLFVCLELKDNKTHHGLLRMCSYILQTISADPAFGQALTNPITLALPQKYAVVGTAADFMIVSIYSIATTSGLNPLFPALTIAIANIAPYLKDLGVQASTRLMQLFTAFSQPGFLLGDEGHPRLVNYLLEVFNSVIFYQFSSNPNLIYSILRAHNQFHLLATLSLKTGLSDIQRIKKARAAALDAKKLEGVPEENEEKSSLLQEDERSIPSTRSTMEISRTEGSDTAGTNNGTAIELTTPSERDDPLQNSSYPPAPVGMSEKARGKRRASASDNDNGGDEGLSEELEKMRLAGIGSGKYVPTEEWVRSWQKGLPLDPILVFVSELLPRIEALQASRTQGPNKEVIKVLRTVDLSTVLPPPPPIISRKFMFSSTSKIWLTSLLWGDIYVSGLPQGLWNNTGVRLFGVTVAKPGRNALQGVQGLAGSVGGLLAAAVNSAGRPANPRRSSSSVLEMTPTRHSMGNRSREGSI